jgi:hypothetical protein
LRSLMVLLIRCYRVVMRADIITGSLSCEWELCIAGF